MNPADSSRRDFLAGRSLRSEVESAARQAGDALIEAAPDLDGEAPVSGPTIRLGTRAMACDFHVVLNAGPDSTEEAWYASDALNAVHQLEDQMTVYRDTSELLELNRGAVDRPVTVEPRLFDLLLETRRICHATGGAFDPTTQPVVTLWRECRAESRIPTEAEIHEVLQRVGVQHVEFKSQDRTVRFRRAGLELNLNGIGKGYALDRAGEILDAGESGRVISNWLLHGGHSSVLARGAHAWPNHQQAGWPVGIRNPLFPDRRLATVILRNQALGTSGSGVQFFRVGGKRYGHVLDPQTGWPVDHLLSVSVIAGSAAEADALSTAFFVMGLEKTIQFCQDHPGVGALLVPPPSQGRMLQPVVCGIPDEDLHLLPEEPGPRGD